MLSWFHLKKASKFIDAMLSSKNTLEASYSQRNCRGCNEASQQEYESATNHCCSTTDGLIDYWASDAHGGPDGQQLESIECSACAGGLNELHDYPYMGDTFGKALCDLLDLNGDDLLQGALAVGRQTVTVLMENSVTARAVHAHWKYVLRDVTDGQWSPIPLMCELASVADCRMIEELLRKSVQRLLTLRMSFDQGGSMDWLWGLSVGAVASLTWVKWQAVGNLIIIGKATSGHNKRRGNAIGMVGNDANKKRDAVDQNQASVLMHLICKAICPVECIHTRNREVSAMSFLIDYKREMAKGDLSRSLEIASEHVANHADLAKWNITDVILSLCDSIDAVVDTWAKEMYGAEVQVQLDQRCLVTPASVATACEGADLMMLFNYAEWGSPHTDFGSLRHESGCLCNMEFYGRATVSGAFSSCIERGVDTCLGELSQAMLLNENQRERHLSRMVDALDISTGRSPMIGIILDEIYWSLCDCRHRGADKISRAWKTIGQSADKSEANRDLDCELTEEASAASDWALSFGDVRAIYKSAATIAEKWGWGRYVEYWLGSAIHYVCVATADRKGSSCIDTRGAFIYKRLAQAVHQHGSHHAFTAMVASVIESAGLWPHIFEVGYDSVFFTKK